MNIIGTGLSENLQIANGPPINASILIRNIANHLQPTLKSNGVHTIDTSPIMNAQAQGLAVSHEPGIIHVDIQKVFNSAKQITYTCTMYLI